MYYFYDQEKVNHTQRCNCGLTWWHCGKNPPASARDMGLIPGPGRSHMPRSN